nr:flagellar biosynthesis anti-sigma factor FlgM [Cohnella sp. CFH 77786]
MANPYLSNSNQRTEAKGHKWKNDEVQFSAEAMEMLSKTRTNGPEREKRVQELKDAVSTGNYHVDTDKLADKILPFVYPVTNK